MKKILLIAGIIFIIACVLFLLYAVLNMHAYYNLYDASVGYYKRLHQRMISSFVTGSVFGAIGAVCFIIRYKM